MTTTKLRHLSICSCGYAVLHDDIAVGTVYQVDFTKEFPATYRCGGCGAEQAVTCVPASSLYNPFARPAPLPVGLFVDATPQAVQ